MRFSAPYDVLLNMGFQYTEEKALFQILKGVVHPIAKRLEKHEFRKVLKQLEE